MYVISNEINMSNEMNSNEILDKFDGFYNGINVIKIIIIKKGNEMNIFWT